MRKYTLKDAFTSHKADAKRRGIPFEFEFSSWLEFWEQSGKFFQRGHGKGKYVMARFADKGPYSPTNVKIILFEDNARERRMSEECKEIIRTKNLGKTVSKITREKLRAINLGKKASVSAREKISAAHIGNKYAFGKTRGESNGNSKLTETEVKQIRKMLLSKTTANIAKTFGIGTATIWRIKNKMTWAHI